MSGTPDTSTEPNCVFDTTIDVATDCSNSWNLSPRSFSMEKIASHANGGVGTHERLFRELDDWLKAFTYENGRGTTDGLSDKYGNKLLPDGSCEGRSTGYACETSDGDLGYDETMSAMNDTVEDLKRRAEAKVGRYTFAKALSFHDGIIDKKDTVYELKQATPSLKGGIKAATDEISDSDDTSPSGDAVYRAMRSLRGSLSGIKPSRIGFRPPRRLVHASPDGAGMVLAVDNSVIVVDAGGAEDVSIVVPSGLSHGFLAVLRIESDDTAFRSVSFRPETEKTKVSTAWFKSPFDVSDSAGKTLLFTVTPGSHGIVLVDMRRYSAVSHA